MIEEKRTIIDNLLDAAEKYYYVLFLCILLLACFNLFYNLSSLPIQDWDEARHGVNAYEMLKNNNYIVNTYGYQNDYYNLKPPLSYWFITAGYKLAGFNPLGLRLYSAVSALATIIIVSLFVKQKHGKVASLISASVLTTTFQYLVLHCARTGDADSIFVLFFTIAMISMAKIDESCKWIYLSGLSFSLAFLAKSWHAFVIAAIGGLYLLFSGYIFKLKLKQWALFAAGSILPIFLWGVLRYANDGVDFFKDMIDYDLLARSATTLEGHKGNFLFYFNKIFNYYEFWFFVFLCVVIYCLLLGKVKVDRKRKNYILAIMLWIIVPLIAFSAVKTKIYWYITPIYPALAICIGAFSEKALRINNRKIIIQLLLIVSLITSLVYNEEAIATQILSRQLDGTQSTIEKLKNLYDYKGVNAYTMCGSYGEAGHWDQGQFLAAELYGDLRPMDGGIDSFMKDDDKAVLVIPQDSDTDRIIKANELKVLIRTATNLILIKLD